jgi:hypothetical protein
MPANWQRPLHGVVELRDGKSFKTLRDAANYAIEQSGRNEWQAAAGALIAAAKTGKVGDIRTATQAFRNALFVDGLKLRM